MRTRHEDSCQRTEVDEKAPCTCGLEAAQERARRLLFVLDAQSPPGWRTERECEWLEAAQELAEMVRAMHGLGPGGSK